MEMHLRKTGGAIREGRSNLAPEVDTKWEDNDLGTEVLETGARGHDVIILELFAVPRIGPANNGMGIRTGRSVDIKTGEDLRKEEVWERIRAYVREEKPDWVIGGTTL